MNDSAEKSEKIEKTDAEWREQLTPEQYYITRQKGTEPAFSGALYKNHADEFIIAWPAMLSCSARIPSSSPAPAGRVSGFQLLQTQSKHMKTPAMECVAWRLRVPVAALISAMFFPMGPSRPGCDIASIPHR